MVTATVRPTITGHQTGAAFATSCDAQITPEIAAALARRFYGVRRPRNRDIFIRDRWLCQLCGGTIDRRLSSPDPFAATVDHRIPRVRGGTNDSLNLQAAHAICNHVRGDIPLDCIDAELFADVRREAERWLRAQRRYRDAMARLEHARRRWQRKIRRARAGQPTGRRLRKTWGFRVSPRRAESL
jgi:hypothetical protein